MLQEKPDFSPVEAPPKRLPVLLPYPFAGPFDYAALSDETLRPGDIVLVPLNRRQEVGVVWDAPAGPAVPAAKLKPVTARLDASPMPAALRHFIDWVAAYTLAAPGEVLAMVLRVNALTPPVPKPGWQAADPQPVAPAPTEPRRRVLAVLADGQPRSAPEIARLAGVSAAVIRAMATAGLLSPAPVPAAKPFATPDPAHQHPVLSAEQEAVAAALRAAVERAAFSVTLLDGVTGSGKTEIYLEAVAACLRSGRQSLILLPRSRSRRSSCSASKAVSGGAGGLALRSRVARAQPHLARRRRRRGAGGGGCPLGAVPAISRSRPDRRRRGARDRL